MARICPGYPYNRAFFWPAILTTSLIFGASHLRHSDETYRGALFAVVFAIVLGYSFLHTGSLWFAVGVHATWDYFQSLYTGSRTAVYLYPVA